MAQPSLSSKRMMAEQSRALILASASPRRAELLQQIGVKFVVEAANVDESRHREESPRKYVARLSKLKAQAIVQAEPQTRRENQLILAADTIVIASGMVLGKPVDDSDATRMLKILSNSNHEVLTAVALFDCNANDFCGASVVTTKVCFRPLSDPEISRYVASREPRDKAGAYAIQGLAAAFVVSINGSYSNVVGLPLAETHKMLFSNGVQTGLC